MSVVEWMWLGTQISEKLQHSKNFRSFKGNETCQRRALHVKDMQDGIFILQHQLKWPWGLGHWDSSSTDQRTKTCWDGASSCVGTHFSHTSVVFSTLWGSGNAVSPEHVDCSPTFTHFRQTLSLVQRGPSHWVRSVMCHLLFAEGGCCSILGCPICKQKHEMQYWPHRKWRLSFITVTKQKWGREGRVQRRFSCSHLVEVIGAFGLKPAPHFAVRGFTCRS